MHSESSLSLLDKVSRKLGQVLWKLRDESAQAYHTFELPREYMAHQHQMQARDPSKSGQSSVPKPKGLNLKTYKFHAIGDYGPMIAQFGTTDSYTTQIMCYVVPMFHRFLYCFRMNLLTGISNHFIA